MTFATLSRRRLLPAAVAFALIGALAACASAVGSSTDGQSDSVGADRSEIIGRWVRTDGGASPDAFVQFDDDGTVTLSDGCNGGVGTWNLDGGAFSAETGPHTEMYCDGLIDLHTWLYTARSVELEDGLLVLLAEDGAEVGRLTPSADGAMPIEPGIGDGSSLPVSPTAAELEGSWGPSDVDPASASTSSPIAGSYVRFAADGTVEASDGCIVQSGTWSIDGQQLTAALAQDAAKTGDRACDAILRYGWLSGTHAAVLIDGNVHVWDELGNDIGVLYPQP